MPRTWTSEHAINLKTWRKAQRLSQDLLARKSGLELATLQALESAEELELADDQVLGQLAKSLGLLPKQLCNSPLTASKAGRKVINFAVDGQPVLENSPAPSSAAHSEVSEDPGETSTEQRSRRAIPVPVLVGGGLLIGLLLAQTTCSQQRVTTANELLPLQRPAVAAEPPDPAIAWAGQIVEANPADYPRMVDDMLKGDGALAPEEFSAAIEHLNPEDAAPMLDALLADGSREAMAVLVEELLSDDPQFVTASVQRLVQLNPQEMRRLLLETVQEENPERAQALLVVLVIVLPPEDLAPVMNAYLKSEIKWNMGILPQEHPAVNSALAFGAGELSPMVQESLKDTMHDTKRDPHERARIATSLLGTAADSEADETLRELVPNEPTLLQQIRALDAELGDELLDDAIESGWRDSEVADPRAAQAMQLDLLMESDPARALAGLASLGVSEIDRASALTRSPEADHRADAVDLFIEALNSDTSSVDPRDLRALEQLAGRIATLPAEERQVETLTTALASASPEAQVLIIRVLLGTDGQVEALEALQSLDKLGQVSATQYWRLMIDAGESAAVADEINDALESIAAGGAPSADEMQLALGYAVLGAETPARGRVLALLRNIVGNAASTRIVVAEHPAKGASWRTLARLLFAPEEVTRLQAALGNEEHPYFLLVIAKLAQAES